jgi:hypothetical protein
VVREKTPTVLQASSSLSRACLGKCIVFNSKASKLSRFSSQVVHAVAQHPTGPYKISDIAMGSAHTNPQIMRTPDGHWVRSFLAFPDDIIDTLKEPASFMCMCSCCFHKQRAQTISTSMCALGATKACAGLSAVTGLRTSRRCHPATCRFRDESGAGKRSSLILTLSNRKDRRTKSEAEECLLQAKNAVRFGRGTNPSIQQRRPWRCRGAPKPWLAAQQPPLYDGHRDP